MSIFKVFNKKEKPKEPEDILCVTKQDRRLLTYVKDTENIRTKLDRRTANSEEQTEYIKNMGDFNLRYIAEYDVKAKIGSDKKFFSAKSKDISTTGMLMEINEKGVNIEEGDIVHVRFSIKPGTMPEGFESKIKIDAEVIRIVEKDEDGYVKSIGIKFTESLAKYVRKRRGLYSLTIASLFMFIVVLTVMLMRAESIVYFKYNKILYLYSILAASFLLSRYLFGFFYRPVPVNPHYTPGVTVIIPCFNEEQWIARTITSCINQDYPVDKLEVIVVDDCSNDNSAKVIKEAIERIHKEGERFKTKDRVSYFIQPQNKGKRDALAIGAEMAKHELLVFVDSDSFLEPVAIRNLVQPFQDPKMGGVTGRTDVENKYTNGLTKMQTVRYYVAFRVMKAAEAYFDAATCLSGPISCYRKDLVLKYKDDWLNQKFLGHAATFGDDRSLTNFILRHNRTSYQDTAVCTTIVPTKYDQFLKQQMRWKRSWLRESIIAARYIWKKEPFMSTFFYMGLLVPIAAPIIVIYNFIYVPIVNSVFPTTFLLGLLMMALLMSFADLFYKRSSLWFFGMMFCIFYEGVLLWQMPLAWFTFWKSTWGTRMTPSDIEAMNKKKAKSRKGLNRKKGAVSDAK